MMGSPTRRVPTLSRTMPETAPREIDLLGKSVTYEVRRSEEATEPRIDVDIHGVRVVLPWNEETDPETLLQENATWVLEKTNKYEWYRKQIPERRFEPGATFPYLGQPCEVIVEQRPSSSITEGAFRLARHQVADTSIKRALETVYRRQARQRFERRADHYAAEMGIEYERIEIRNQRTKWGSCSATGTLGLNWRLMMAPPEIGDYIVVHELAHLRENNHSEAFWSIVSEYVPSYREHEEWLEQNSVKLIFSEEDL
jgi:predicted metal-dependent hydrolase